MKIARPEEEKRMKKVIVALESEYRTIRAGRANPQILDRITVDYYGTPTPINQMASVGAADARTLTITPWDASQVKPITKAIQTSDIGINPQEDGKTIRLNFPPLTEEKRKDIVKDIKKIAEESKVAVRNIRRDIIDKYRTDKKNSVITEDDLKIAEEDIQELTDKFIKEIDALAVAKEKEILEI